MKSNSIYHHNPSKQLQRTLLCCLEAHLLLSNVTRMSFWTTPTVLMQIFIWNAKRRQIGDYPVKGKGCRDLFVDSVGARMVSQTSPSPLWGLLGSINTMRTGHWLPKLGRAGDCSISTSGRHYAVAARGWNAWDPMTRERLRVLTKLCVLCREGLNYIVLWVLEYETVTSWEILRVERGWYWEVKTKMMGDSEIECALSTWRVSMAAHA